jgi:amino acid transporter
MRFRRTANPPRVWSPGESLLVDFSSVNVIALLGALLLAGLAATPFWGMALVAFIVAALGLTQSATYAFLTSSFPRDGGDYIILRRLLSPSVAAVIAFAGSVGSGALFLVVGAWFAARVSVGPVLIASGAALRVPSLVRLGEWMTSPVGLLAAGLVLIAVGAGANLLRLSTVALLGRRALLVGLAATAVLLVCLALSRTQLQSYALRALSVSASVHPRDGVGHGGVDWAALRLLPLVALGFIHPGWSAFLAGEVKLAGRVRAQWWALAGAKGAALLAFAGVVVIVHWLVPPAGFWAALLAVQDPHWLAGAVPRAGHGGVWWLALAGLALAANLWLVLWATGLTLSATRVLLGLSWDGLLPRWVASLDARSGAPARAVGLFAALCAGTLVACWPLGVGGELTTAAVLSAISCGAMGLAAVAFPVARRELYRSSTASPYELLNVPLISILGTASVVFAGYLIASYLSWLHLLGSGRRWPAPLALALVYVGSACLYLCFRWYRRHHEGVDIQMYFHEPAPRDAGGTT